MQQQQSSSSLPPQQQRLPTPTLQAQPQPPPQSTTPATSALQLFDHDIISAHNHQQSSTMMGIYSSSSSNRSKMKVIDERRPTTPSTTTEEAAQTTATHFSANVDTLLVGAQILSSQAGTPKTPLLNLGTPSNGLFQASAYRNSLISGATASAMAGVGSLAQQLQMYPNQQPPPLPDTPTPYARPQPAPSFTRRRSSRNEDPILAANLLMNIKSQTNSAANSTMSQLLSLSDAELNAFNDSSSMSGGFLGGFPSSSSSLSTLTARERVRRVVSELNPPSGSPGTGRTPPSRARQRPSQLSGSSANGNNKRRRTTPASLSSSLARAERALLEASISSVDRIMIETPPAKRVATIATPTVAPAELVARINQLPAAAKLPRATLQQILSQPASGITYQEARFPDDLYTPRFVRGAGVTREGLCLLCSHPKWHKIKVSAYWQHMHWHHGISSATGRQMPLPVETKDRQALCGSCQKWVSVDGPSGADGGRLPASWWKHVQKCQKM